MALDKAVVPILFSGALDQKTNFKTVMPGKFLTLQNAVRRKANLFQKRYGFSAMTLAYTLKTLNNYGAANFSGSGNFINGEFLSSFSGVPIMGDGVTLYSYSNAKAAWRGVNVLPSLAIDTRPIGRTGGNQTQADMAINGNFSAIVYYDTDADGVYWRITDDTTGLDLSGLQAIALGSNTVRSPRVVAVSNGFQFAWTDTGDGTKIFLGFVSTTSPATMVNLSSGAPGAAGISVDFNGNLDLTVWDGSTTVYAVCTLNNANGHPHVSRGRVDPVGGITLNGSTDVNAVFGATSLTCIGVTTDVARDRIHVFYAPNNNDIAYSIFHGQANVTIITTVAHFIARLGAGGFRNATAAVDTGTGNIYGFFEEYGFTGGGHTVMSTSWVHGSRITYDGVNPPVAGQDYYIQGVGLVSKAYLNTMGTGDVVSFATVSHETELQPSYYSINGNCKVIARFATAKAGGFWKTTAFNGSSPSWSSSLVPGVAGVWADSTGAYVTVLQNQVSTQLTGTGSSLQKSRTVYGLQRYAFNQKAAKYSVDSLNGLTYIAAGQVRVFDGTSITEQGTHTYPDRITSGHSAGTGSLLASTYTFRVTWEWTDNQGNVHQSAPSPAQSQATNAGDSLLVTVPRPALGERSNSTVAGETGLKAVLWLAESGLSEIFYRMQTLSATSYGSVAFTQNTYPTAQEEVLYTTGGIFENLAAPFARVCKVFKNRLWLGGLETSELAYSKEAVEGEGLGFPDQFRMPISSEGGPVTALAVLDSNLIIFKKDRIYYLTGEGPNTAGQQNDYPEPVKIQTDVGTSLPQSVVETDRGIVFKTGGGYYMLSRRLEVSYVGKDVEDFNNLTVSSAIILPDVNECRFTHSNGSCLVYNYFFNQWSEFTNYTAVSSTVINDVPYHLKANGTVNKETTAYLDQATPIDMVVETSWLALAQFQGFQRIYKMLLSADYVNDFHLKLSIAYDEGSGYNQVITPVASTLVTGSLLQVRIQPANQKCSAIKLKIETIDDIGAGGANFMPTALTMEVGRKRGAYRLPAAKTI